MVGESLLLPLYVRRKLDFTIIMHANSTRGSCLLFLSAVHPMSWKELDDIGCKQLDDIGCTKKSAIFDGEDSFVMSAEKKITEQGRRLLSRMGNYNNLLHYILDCLPSTGLH